LSPRRALLPQLSFIALLLLLIGAGAAPLFAQDKEKKEKEKSPPAAGQPKDKVKVRVKEKTAPPAKVTLPKEGIYPAEEILALAGKLHGRTVRLEGERVEETKVEISGSLAGRQVSLEELTLLLAAHHLYLFPVMDPEEGNILVVSRNPRWTREPPRFTKIIQVSNKSFQEAWESIQRSVSERNSKLPKSVEPITAVSSARTGKIFIRASRSEDIEAISKAAEAFLEKDGVKDANRPRLYTYQGRFRTVEELEEKLVKKLTGEEVERLRIVIGQKGNRLYYRCPAALADKVSGLLKELDVPKKKGEEEPAGEPGHPGES
jgi:hypothetical protein